MTSGCRAKLRRPRRTPTPTPTPTPSPTPTATNSDQSAGTARDQSRQQFPGAARQPGVWRLRPGVAKQSRRRRRFGERRRRRVTAPGSRATASRSRTDAQGDFVGDQRKTYGGVAGFGARLAPGVNLGFSVDQSHTDIDVPLALQSATLDLTQIRFQRLGRQGTMDLGRRAGARLRQGQFQPGHRLWPCDRGLSRRVDGALTEISYYWSQGPDAASCRRARWNMCAPTSVAFQEIGGLDPVRLGCDGALARARHDRRGDRALLDLRPEDPGPVGLRQVRRQFPAEFRRGARSASAPRASSCRASARAAMAWMPAPRPRSA